MFASEDMGLILFLTISSIIVLAIQLLLCFKVKMLFIRLLPNVATTILALIFYDKSELASGWDGLGFALISIYVALLGAVCLLGWAIWGITYGIKKWQQKKSNNITTN